MISVCMATFNGEKYIKEQLISILKQLNDEDEVIISDDGSTDSTLKIINNINDRRVKVYINTKNHGYTPNFENALEKAKGDYIFLSDQDDIWKENKTKIIIQKLKDYDLVIHDCTTFNNNGIIQESRFKAFNIKPKFINHLIKSRYLGCCMAFNKKMLNTILPFPKNYSLVEHDIWIAAIGLLYFKTVQIDDKLILYRRHNLNASDGGFEKGYSIINKVERRIYRLYNLFRVRNRIRD